jgi:enamine deaminase RidA (YjgF/YER057c/UK114 family)
VQAFENVKKVLTAAGATFDDVVEMITYHVTGEALDYIQDDRLKASDQQQMAIPYLPLFMQVKDRYFINKFPTWTGFGVTTLSTRGLIIEIKCTAVLPD